MLSSSPLLVYVTTVPDAALIAHLRAAGWAVEVVAQPNRAGAVAKQWPKSAGLIDLGSVDAGDWRVVETLLQTSRINWVAAVKAGQMTDESVRRLIGLYCFDYVTLPTEPARIAAILGHARGMSALNDEMQRAEGGTTGDAHMIGDCEAMQRLFRMVRKVAATDAPVFIAGESGTGKELTAQAIHERSPRRKAPFVAINCGAIPPHLLQSELFGYERGAFTGAHQRKIGRVEAADGGTLFLDEIGDLPLESQASLLRFLQEGKIERLGGHESIAVDVRVISATHVDLEGAMDDARFRADLFHRLCVLRVDEPPLRARGKDIELLAHHMLHKYKSDSARKIRGFAASGIEAMHEYTWPGNVRELINRVRRAIVMAEGKLIGAEDLGLQPASAQPGMTLVEAREAAEKKVIETALLRHGDRINEAAAELGVSRSTLYRLMVRYGLRDANGESELPHADDLSA
ncbi:sigma-54 dependent transcriptional regulator [Trinickia fusca]|uniref:Sigma-54-dependent Fis family transcriptional regulator n=1 Tax=Trinickia fusca TaxID=2419777 RepID=A0A494XEE8_9BURK|nr:sigma-54 dependent transcriptional regulator [Trinickia fusca]RKP45973.1 sigma-54-dependent Fis family transcriptional regulator [Trinickia fusca]